MKRAEILLNLIIGICGSLIAAVIYSHLQKIRWKRVSKQFIRKAKETTNDSLVTLVIATAPLRSRKLRFPLQATAAALVMLVIMSSLLLIRQELPPKYDAIPEMAEQATPIPSEAQGSAEVSSQRPKPSSRSIKPLSQSMPSKRTMKAWDDKPRTVVITVECVSKCA